MDSPERDVKQAREGWGKYHFLDLNVNISKTVGDTIDTSKVTIND